MTSGANGVANVFGRSPRRQRILRSPAKWPVPCTPPVAYPLSFPEVSTVVLSCKSVQQAEVNFSALQPASLSPTLLDRIERVQRTHRLFEPGRTARILRPIVSAVSGDAR